MKIIDLERHIKKHNIKFIRVLWNDSANQIRAKAVSTDKLDDLVSYGVAISKAQQAVPFMYDVPELSTGLGPVGEVRIRPDWETFSIIPNQQNQGWVLGSIYDGDKVWSHCPRAFLIKMLNELRDLNIELKVGLENEFYLYSINELDQFINDGTLFAENQAIEYQSIFLNQLLVELESQHIGVDLFHAEAGPSQFEFSLKHNDALKAIDNQIFFKELVRATAFGNNLRSTFVPKLYENQAGSGCHIHLSFWKNGENVTASSPRNTHLSSISSNFIAGVLENLAMLLSVTTPTTNSFRRLAPRCWAGAFNIWGMNNREAAVRVPIVDHRGKISNIEFKTVDNTANLYLALGAIIACGINGIKNKSQLRKAVDFDPGSKSEQELKKFEIQKLPDSLGVSLDLFKKNTLIRKAMGEALHQSYAAVKTAEYEYMKDKSFKEEVELMIKRF